MMKKGCSGKWLPSRTAKKRRRQNKEPTGQKAKESSTERISIIERKLSLFSA